MNQLENDLIEYVKSGNRKAIIDSLSKNVNISSLAVMKAIKNEHYDIVELFIEHGYDIKENGDFILRKLIYSPESFDSIKYLIDNYVTINEIELIRAIMCSSHKISAFMIEKSDLSEDSYIRAFHEAAMDKYNDLIKPIITKIKNSKNIDKLIIRAMIYEYTDYEISILICNSKYIGQGNYCSIFKNIISNYSEDDYKDLICNNIFASLYCRYILENKYTDFRKIDKILREYGIDIYDMIEKES